MLQARTSAQIRLSALGILLCLLAALFSIEAKVAWYSPQGSPTANISAAKLQSAEAPRLIARAIARTAPLVYLPEVAVALVLAILGASVRVFTAVPACATPAQLPGYYPSLFFRPPPIV